MLATINIINKNISIHALRVEGDGNSEADLEPMIIFQSTPSVWRATLTYIKAQARKPISIHALRVEGDWRE